MIFIQGDERATHSQIVQIMDIARQVGLVNQIIATEPQPAKDKGAAKPSRNDGIWREAMSTDPNEWSDELKAQLLRALTTPVAPSKKSPRRSASAGSGKKQRRPIQTNGPTN